VRRVEWLCCEAGGVADMSMKTVRSLNSSGMKTSRMIQQCINKRMLRSIILSVVLYGC